MTSPNLAAELIEDLQRRLAEHAAPETKAWFEAYLKGAVPFRGLKTPQVAACLETWRRESPSLDDDVLRAVAFGMLESDFGDDKLAGILILQDRVRRGVFDPTVDLAAIAGVFDAGHIADWSTCDWMCVRVLARAIEAHGIGLARSIASWVDAPGLWRRRAAAVSLVPVVRHGDATVEGAIGLAMEVAASNVVDDRRFAQTGVGWLLREVSSHDPSRVEAFIAAHRAQMSREAIRMAAARLSDACRAELGLRGPRRRR